MQKLTVGSFQTNARACTTLAHTSDMDLDGPEPWIFWVSPPLFRLPRVGSPFIQAALTCSKSKGLRQDASVYYTHYIRL